MDARISTSLPSHPKTKKLARRLGPSGPLGCIYLFLWVAANRSDGDLSGLTDEDLELAVDWQGDEGQFIACMSEVGFLDGEEGSRSVHDWAVHNPWAAGANDRSEASRWAALCKRYGRDGAAKRMPNYASGVRPACDPGAPRTNPQCDPDAPLPSPIPLPNLEDQKPSSSAKPTTTHAERLAQVTKDATETFNESKLVKPNGGLLATVTKVGNETRQKQVRKCITVARQICSEDYGAERITREFWADYWAECHRDDHKSGRSGGGREHPNWVPTFEYLTREKTMVEVYERAGR